MQARSMSQATAKLNTNIDYKAEQESQKLRPVKDMEIGDTHHTKIQRLQALGDIKCCPDPLLKKI